MFILKKFSYFYTEKNNRDRIKPNPIAISKHIKDLIDLALQDRVLTYKERQTIIEEAKKTGVNIKETEEYLNDALHERLKSYTKEELTRCPACGALVPLISDDCLFCGTHLYKGEAKRHVIKVSGAAADIIREENRQTDIQQQNLTQCQCGAPFPLVSNICSYCGRVLHKNQDSEQNIKNLIMSIQASIAQLRGTMRPTLWMVLNYRKDLICFYLAAVFMVFAAMFESTVFIGLSSAFFVVFAIAMFGKSATDSPVQKADDEYYNALHTYENYQRQTATIYGANPEAQRVLADFSAEIVGYKKSRSRNRNTIAVLMVVVLLIPILLSLYKPYATNRYQAQIESIPTLREMQSYSKTLRPFPELAVAQRFVDYFTVEGNITLTVDALLDREKENINEYDIKYQLRADYVKLVATGKTTERPDTCVLGLWLCDKEGNSVGVDFRPIKIFNWDEDSYRTMLNSGKGHIYAEFTSTKASLQRIKEVADSAYYFTIY